MNASIIQKCTELNNLERHYVQTYAGNLYEPLNHFLVNTDTLEIYHHIYPEEFAQNLYYLITNRPNLYVNGIIPNDREKRIIKLIRSKSGNIDWFRHIMFRFAILLYEIILKCPRQHQEIEVHRGVLTHYLKEDRNNGYFLTSFTSTSINRQTARSFSKDNNNDVIIYHFVLMPGISCIYIGLHEDELLINPYQSYHFVKKDGNHYFYIIRPSDIIPPHNEHEFAEFKRNILTRTVAMEGGKDKNSELANIQIISNHRNTLRLKNNRKKQNTKKHKKQKKQSEADHFRARMNMPIGTSSFGIPNTPEIMKEIERVAREYHV